MKKLIFLFFLQYCVNCYAQSGKYVLVKFYRDSWLENSEKKQEDFTVYFNKISNKTVVLKDTDNVFMTSVKRIKRIFLKKNNIVYKIDVSDIRISKFLVLKFFIDNKSYTEVYVKRLFKAILLLIIFLILSYVRIKFISTHRWNILE